jgi:hypothetical protein
MHTTTLCFNSFLLVFVVRFCDPVTRMAMIRVPREWYGNVRAALTLTTNLDNNTNGVVQIVLRTFAVHGNARTAKIAAIRQVNDTYRRLIILRQQQQSNNKKETEKLCVELEETLSLIQKLE